jgi:hypothetical protein
MRTKLLQIIQKKRTLLEVRWRQFLPVLLRKEANSNSWTHNFVEVSGSSQIWCFCVQCFNQFQTTFAQGGRVKSVSRGLWKSRRKLLRLLFQSRPRIRPLKCTLYITLPRLHCPQQGLGIFKFTNASQNLHPSQLSQKSLPDLFPTATLPFPLVLLVHD